VEEAREVDVHYPALSSPLILARGEHRLVGTASGPKPVAVLREVRLKQRTEHLKRGLLQEPIQYRGHAQPAGSPAGFGYLDASHRLGSITTRQQQRLDFVPLFSNQRRRALEVEPIDTRCSFVPSDLFPRGVQVAAFDHLLHQPCPWPD